MVWHGAMRDDAILNLSLADRDELLLHRPPELMKVAIVGAGIIGVTTAYELTRRRP